MSDFLISTAPNKDDQPTADTLADHRHPIGREPQIESYQSAQLSIAVSTPSEKRLAPRRIPNGFCAAIGRPILSQLPSRTGPLCDALLRNLTQNGHVTILGKLSGHFAIFAVVGETLHLITDPIGSCPVYAAESKGHLVFGTHPEAVAQLANLKRDYDPVSIARLLLESRITYPYTTRRGMIELAPGSHYQITPGTHSLNKLRPNHYWQPIAPTTPPALPELQDELYEGCLQAAREIPQNCSQLSITLSGGSDSRAILGAFKQTTDLPIQALTLADHENRELAIARKVASVENVPHRTLWRPPHYYASLPGIVTLHNGFEHCAADSHLAGFVDDIPPHHLVISGSGADTLLKGEYFEKIPSRMLLNEWILQPPNVKPSLDHFRSQLTSQDTFGLSHDLVDAIARRKWERYRDLEAIRGESAIEWVDIYPNSRRKAISYTLFNARNMIADEFFLHRSIMSVAKKASLWQKVSRRLTTPVFQRLAPKTMPIRDGNTGLPATAPWPLRDASLVARTLPKRAFQKLPGLPLNTVFLNSKGQSNQPHPWQSKGSWVSSNTFVQESDVWSKIARSLCSPPRTKPLKECLGLNHSNQLYNQLTTRPGHQSFTLAQLLPLFQRNT